MALVPANQGYDDLLRTFMGDFAPHFKAQLVSTGSMSSETLNAASLSEHAASLGVFFRDWSAMLKDPSLNWFYEIFPREAIEKNTWALEYITIAAMMMQPTAEGASTVVMPFTKDLIEGTLARNGIQVRETMDKLLDKKGLLIFFKKLQNFDVADFLTAKGLVHSIIMNASMQFNEHVFASQFFVARTPSELIDQHIDLIGALATKHGLWKLDATVLEIEKKTGVFTDLVVLPQGSKALMTFGPEYLTDFSQSGGNPVQKMDQGRNFFGTKALLNKIVVEDKVVPIENLRTPNGFHDFSERVIITGSQVFLCYDDGVFLSPSTQKEVYTPPKIKVRDFTIQGEWRLLDFKYLIANTQRWNPNGTLKIADLDKDDTYAFLSAAAPPVVTGVSKVVDVDVAKRPVGWDVHHGVVAAEKIGLDFAKFDELYKTYRNLVPHLATAPAVTVLPLGTHVLAFNDQRRLLIGAAVNADYPGPALLEWMNGIFTGEGIRSLAVQLVNFTNAPAGFQDKFEALKKGAIDIVNEWNEIYRQLKQTYGDIRPSKDIFDAYLLLAFEMPRFAPPAARAAGQPQFAFGRRVDASISPLNFPRKVNPSDDRINGINAISQLHCQRLCTYLFLDMNVTRENAFRLVDSGLPNFVGTIQIVFPHIFSRTQAALWLAKNSGKYYFKQEDLNIGFGVDQQHKIVFGNNTTWMNPAVIDHRGLIAVPDAKNNGYIRGLDASGVMNPTNFHLSGKISGRVSGQSMMVLDIGFTSRSEAETTLSVSSLYGPVRNLPCLANCAFDNNNDTLRPIPNLKWYQNLYLGIGAEKDENIDFDFRRFENMTASFYPAILSTGRHVIRLGPDHQRVINGHDLFKNLEISKPMVNGQLTYSF